MRAGVVLRSISWCREVREALAEEGGDADCREAAKRFVARLAMRAATVAEIRLRRVRASMVLR